MKFSLQTSVILLLIALIVPLSVVIMAVSYVRSADSVAEVSRSLMEQISAHTVDKSLSYLRPAEQAVQLFQRLEKEGLLTTDDLAEVERYSLQFLKTYPEVTMLDFGFESGDFMMVKRMPDDSFSTKWVRRRDGKGVTQWNHDRPERWSEKYPDATEPLETVYDPRLRPWYIDAKAADGLVWTKAYLFYSDRKPGISCASPIHGREGRAVGVVAADIVIEEISHFIGRLKIGRRGKAFIVDRAGQLVAYPVRREDDMAMLVREVRDERKLKIVHWHIGNCPDPVLVRSFEKLCGETSSATEEVCALREPTWIRYRSEGESYIGMYTPFPANTPWGWTVGVVVPEDDFLSRIKRNNLITLAISLAALVAASGVGIALARRITKPLARLAEESERIRNLDLTHHEAHITSRVREIDDMSRSFENMRVGLRSFEKYVPSQLVRELLKRGVEAELGGEKRKLTILFSDIAGFTPIAEKTDPERLVKALGEYLNALSGIIIGEKGTVDKYVGDAIMAFWGAPQAVEEHARLACRAALRCRTMVKAINESWENEGFPPFRTRFGINTGELIVGNMGCDVRMDYTVIGDSVNLASRLEGLNKAYGTQILVSEETYGLVRDVFGLRKVDWVNVVGKTDVTAVYELLGNREDLGEETVALVRKYEAGLEKYRAREWDAAIRLFEEAEACVPGDRPSRVLIERCRAYQEAPPPDDWDGAIVFTTK
ncbi:MAG: adenylate/guanylate cyclase domain-containing protein [Planctomycetota bacterium]|jgi:adenylate cyclase